MSLVVKCFLGVFFVLCLMQFVEMSRIRREDEKSPVDDVKDTLDKLLTSVKSLLDDDQVKSVISSATETLGDTAKALQDQIKDITSKLTSKE